MGFHARTALAFQLAASDQLLALPEPVQTGLANDRAIDDIIMKQSNVFFGIKISLPSS